VSVRKRIDELTSEPAVGDLGYSADQRQVASAMLGLQLLADEIDEVKRELASLAQAPATAAAQPSPAPPPAMDLASDVGSQLDELTEQLRKLTKALRKASKKKGKQSGRLTP
jgi:hypothetical protein